MWIDLSKWVKDVKMLLSQVNVHQKVTSAIPAIAKWAHEQSGPGGRDWGYALTQQHGLPFI